MGRVAPDSEMVAGVLGLVAILVGFTSVLVLGQPKAEMASATRLRRRR